MPVEQFAAAKTQNGFTVTYLRNGQRVSIEVSGLEDVKRIADRLSEEEGTDDLTRVKTLNRMLNAYLASKLEIIQDSTFNEYEKLADRFLEECPATLVSESSDIEKWLHGCQWGSSTKSKLADLLSAASLHINGDKRFDYLKSIFKHNKKSVAYALSLSEIESLYRDTAMPIRFYLSLGLQTGARPGELLGLLWSDIKDGHLVFSRQRKARDGKRVKVGLKTQDKRSFPINEKLDKALTFIHCYSMNKSENAPILQDEAGNPLSYHRVTYHWRHRMPAGTTPYNLRDTFITQQLGLGVPVAVVAAWVGNSPAVIQRHYADSIALSKHVPK